MAPMIDYAVLCRAIEDWKGGQAPRASRPPPPRPSRPAAPQPVEALEAEGEEIQEQQSPEDRTIIYQMPEIVDEGDV